MVHNNIVNEIKPLELNILINSTNLELKGTNAALHISPCASVPNVENSFHSTRICI